MMIKNLLNSLFVAPIVFSIATLPSSAIAEDTILQDQNVQTEEIEIKTIIQEQKQNLTDVSQSVSELPKSDHIEQKIDEVSSPNIKEESLEETTEPVKTIVEQKLEDNQQETNINNKDIQQLKEDHQTKLNNVVEKNSQETNSTTENTSTKEQNNVSKNDVNENKTPSNNNGNVVKNNESENNTPSENKDNNAKNDENENNTTLETKDNTVKNNESENNTPSENKDNTVKNNESDNNTTLENKDNTVKNNESENNTPSENKDNTVKNNESDNNTTLENKDNTVKNNESENNTPSENKDNTVKNNESDNNTTLENKDNTVKNNESDNNTPSENKDNTVKNDESDNNTTLENKDNTVKNNESENNTPSENKDNNAKNDENKNQKNLSTDEQPKKQNTDSSDVKAEKNTTTDNVDLNSNKTDNNITESNNDPNQVPKNEQELTENVNSKTDININEYDESSPDEKQTNLEKESSPIEYNEDLIPIIRKDKYTYSQEELDIIKQINKNYIINKSDSELKKSLKRANINEEYKLPLNHKMPRCKGPHLSLTQAVQVLSLEVSKQLENEPYTLELFEKDSKLTWFGLLKNKNETYIINNIFPIHNTTYIERYKLYPGIANYEYAFAEKFVTTEDEDNSLEKNTYNKNIENIDDFSIAINHTLIITDDLGIFIPGEKGFYHYQLRYYTPYSQYTNNASARNIYTNLVKKFAFNEITYVFADNSKSKRLIINDDRDGKFHYLNDKGEESDETLDLCYEYPIAAQ